MEAQRDEERKQWLTLERKKCLYSSYNNHCGSHVTTGPRLSQGVSNDHAVEHVPGLVLQQPLIRARSYKASGSGARGQRASRQVILSAPPVTSCECFLSFSSDIALSALRHLLLTGCFSCGAALFFVFFLQWLCQVTRFCFTFVLRLLIIWPNFFLKPCFDRHYIVTSDPPSLLDAAVLISFY